MTTSSAQSVLRPLLTPWGEELQVHRERIPLPEYPRPSLVRQNWLCLNGEWEYAIRRSKEAGIREETGQINAFGSSDGRIRVPFSPECILSGVQRQLQPGETLWYRRTFAYGEVGPEQEVLLHIGAADQRARVWINGSYAGEHEGGYLPFTLPIGALLHSAENEIIIAVEDDSDTSYHARGKQKLKRGGMFYTATSGIWQTVWLETVPRRFIRSVETSAVRPEGTTVEKPAEKGLQISTDQENNEAGNSKEKGLQGSDGNNKKNDKAENAADRTGVNDKTIWIRVNSGGLSEPVGRNVQNRKNEENSGMSPGKCVHLTVRRPMQYTEDYIKTAEDALRLRQEPLLEMDVPADTWTKISVTEPQLWTQNTPWLYGLTVTMGLDEAESYFALRRFSSEPMESAEDRTDGNGGWNWIHLAGSRTMAARRERIAAWWRKRSGPTKGLHGLFLNGELQRQRGVLDQGYWSDGLYTAPSDEALIYDIQRMKELDFNMLRKHIKIEPERWYYHCDRLGMAVWQDMVCGGGAYRSWFVTYMATLVQQFPLRIRDTHRLLFVRREEAGRREFEQEMLETAQLLHSHPCICTWVIFNEGWGQFETKQLTALLKGTDPEHLIDSASGWFDQGCGDFQSVHHYYMRMVYRRRDTRIRVLSEFGGLPLGIEDHMAGQKVYGYGKTKDIEDLNRKFREIIHWADELEEHGFCGYVYTQVSDVEEEINGILTFDRRVQKITESCGHGNRA